MIVVLLNAGMATAAPTLSCHLSDRARPSPAYPGELRASDVVMRSLVPRPITANDPYDTLQAIRDFHVTRLEWTYGLTADVIAKAQALGCTVSGAAGNHSIAGVDQSQPNWFLPLSVLDLNGEAVEAPWMRPWPGHALWACVNSPAARAASLAYMKRLVDLGVRDIQRDDPSMNLTATNWGACFCPYCVAGFRLYLQQRGDREQLAKLGVTDLTAFDYAAYLRDHHAPVGDDFGRYPADGLKTQFLAYQQQATIDYHRWWRNELDRYAGRHIPVSSNNGAMDFGPIHQLFDFYIGELSWEMARPETLYEAMDQAHALGKHQTVTMPLRREASETPAWIARTRQTIATCYALGMHIEAPWDTYLPIVTETPARYFGKPEDSADLFALVRACPEFLDGYEEAAVTGGLLDERPWQPDTRPVTVWSPTDEVYAFARAVPGKPSAPVVVQLVDWSDNPQPCTVSFNPDTLFAGQPLQLTLITPQPYNREAHAAAFDSHDYSALVRKTPLAEGAVTTCEIPALKPWGLLVISPLPDQRQLWPPRLIRTELNAADAIGAVSLSAGATLRYTTDGTDPKPSSPILKQPVPLAMVSSPGITEFRARSYRGGEASPVATLAHLPTARHWRDLLVNGGFSEGKTGWQPVVMAPLQPTALEFDVAPIPQLDHAMGAHLRITATDGVPYHLRLTQPVAIKAGAQVQLRATLMADRPARIRIGLQEVPAPNRVVGVRVLEIGPKPTRLLLAPTNDHPDLQAQFQLDLGYCEPGTTVWLAGARLTERVE